jgi:predicted AAA+ superfamily ATPase
MMINYDSLGNDLQLSRQTISKYFHYLEQCFVISISYNYSRNFRTSAKKNKKVYLAHPSLIQAFLKDVSPSLMGKLVENAVVSQYEETFFYRKGSSEIDIIAPYEGKPVPIEIKFQNAIGKSDLKAIKGFLQKNDSKFGVLVTLDEFAISEKIITIPVYVYLALEDPLGYLTKQLKTE